MGLEGFARGGPKHLEEARRVRAPRRCVEVEVGEVERERAVVGPADHRAHLLLEARPPVGGEPHHLVLALVDLEAQESRERGVEHPERMGKRSSRARSIAHEPSGCFIPRPTESVAHSPTPSAVRIAASRVGAVRKAAAACDWWCSVKRILRAGTPRREAMMPFTHAFSPSVFFMARGKLRQERGKARSAVKTDALELQHRLLVEHHRVEVVRLEPGLAEAPLDGRQREAGVVLPPREPLLLDGDDRQSVDDQGRRGVVVVRGDAEDRHGSVLAPERGRSLAPHRLAPAGALAASGALREEREERQRRKYCARRRKVPSTPAIAVARRR